MTDEAEGRSAPRRRSLERSLWLMAGVVVVAAGVYLLFRPSSSPALAPLGSGLAPWNAPAASFPPVRPVAPAFALPSLHGGTIRLSDFRGKVVLLNFFASWCAPCAAEAPELQRTFLKYRERGVVFLGVAVLDQFADAAAFLERHGITYPAVIDQGTMMQQYGVIGLPASIFIDPQGRIAGRFVGPFLGPEGVAELEYRLVLAGAE